MPQLIRAFILVNTIPGTSEEIVKSRRIPGVKVTSSVYGQYDAVVVVEVKDLQALARIVYELIAQHPNVMHTETLISPFETEPAGPPPDSRKI
jgi:DNA-binding Lrp family transcriptional regulator